MTRRWFLIAAAVLVALAVAGAGMLSGALLNDDAPAPVQTFTGRWSNDPSLNTCPLASSPAR